MGRNGAGRILGLRGQFSENERIGDHVVDIVTIHIDLVD